MSTGKLLAGVSRRTFIGSAAGGTALSIALGQRGVAQQQPAPGNAAPPPKKAKVTSSLMIWVLKGDFDQKLAKAAEAGVQSIELVSEQTKWSDAEAAHYLKVAQSYNLGFDALLAQTNWTRRPVTMVNPSHREAFLQDLRDSIVWAKKLHCPQLILMSGNVQPDMSHEAQYASMVEAGKQAVPLAEAANVTLILENLNSKVNHPGYFLTSARESLRAVKEVDSPRFRMLFDIYHEYTQNGDPMPLVTEAAPYVNVFHVADSPGRNDPGTGQMKWDDIYRAIGKAGYSGYIALEYTPKTDEVESLKRALTQMRKDLNEASTAGPDKSAV